MKKRWILAVVSACMIGGPVAAEDFKTEFCTSLSELAVTIMTQRQNGMSMGEMMGRLENVDEGVRPLIRAMIMDAYAKPSFTSPEVQREVINDFRDMVDLSCYSSDM